MPILLAEDEAGFLSWQLPENHDELLDAGETRTRDGDAGRTASRASQSRSRSLLRPTAQTRGFAGYLAKKAFRVVSAVLFDRLLEEGGEKLAQWMEHDRPHQLRAFGPDEYQSKAMRTLDGRDLATLAASGPALLFIHGTNNLSHGAFHALPQSYMRELWDRYQGRVLAFDHPTLSVDPAKNATWLAEQLPPGLGLEVDVISHSRGGLVARVSSPSAARSTDSQADSTCARSRSWERRTGERPSARPSTSASTSTPSRTCCPRFPTTA